MENAELADVHEKIGGIPDVMGPWQLELMKKCGLEPDDTLLDLGCGTLRGGLHLIRYLDEGKYTGVDPLPELLADGQRLIEQANLEDRRAVLLELSAIDTIEHGVARFVLTQSVLNHLGEEQIEATVSLVARVMSRDGVWVSTGQISDAQTGVDVGRPHPSRPNERLHSVMGMEWFQKVLARNGMRMKVLRDHPHPRGLDVFMVQRAIEGTE